MLPGPAISPAPARDRHSRQPAGTHAPAAPLETAAAIATMHFQRPLPQLMMHLLMARRETTLPERVAGWPARPSSPLASSPISSWCRRERVHGRGLSTGLTVAEATR